MESLVKDLRYGLRALVQSPVVTTVAVLSLALGIGANTAMFSWINAILLQPVRVADPQGLVRMHITHPGDFLYGSYSWPDFVDQRRMNRTLSDMIAFQPTPLSFSTADATERVAGELVSANYFDVLGVEMALGRSFRADENEVPVRDAVAVLHHGFWQRRLGADPEVVGDTIMINGTAFSVIGVTPRDFKLASIDVAVDVFVPMMMRPVAAPDFAPLDSRGSRSIQVIGRLAAGVGLEEAQANFDAVGAQLAEQYPETTGEQGVLLVELDKAIFPPDARGTVAGMFAVLMGVVGFVLLIACANVANLLLARASKRRREIGVRLALGASRGRLLRQLLTESLLLAAAAAGLGVILATVLNRLILTIQPPLDVPITLDVPLDLRVLGFTALAAAATAILFGLAPALQATRHDVAAAFRGGARAVAGGRSRLRSVLVVSQIALSMVLLVGAGLFVRSLQNAHSIDPGFDPDNLLLAALDAGLQGYEVEQAHELFRRVEERVGSLPGVRSTAVGETLPFGFSSQQSGFEIDGHVPGPEERTNIDYNIVGPGYFETMGIALIAGRGFSPQDGPDGQGVLVVNETMARRYWPGQGPLGRRITTLGRDRIVIGVVRDSTYYRLGEDPLPFMYGPLAQTRQTAMVLHVRSESDPLAMVARVRAETSAIDPDMPLFNVKTMSEQVGGAMLFPRLTAGLLGSFGTLALLLAAVGLYGVMSFSVATRTREIGIRIALGAARAAVRSLVLLDAGRLAVVGLAVGMALGLGLGTAATALLYDVSAFDPLVFAVCFGTVVVVAILAVLQPALRACRVDPMVALRNE